MSAPLSTLDTHLAGLAAALLPYRQAAGRLADWGTELAWTLAGGGRLLAAGNGGSAAEAQHLTAELVGKLRDDREPYSAIALHAETSSMTAIGNDYGYDEVFARQVRAHGRDGDVLLLLSTSGSSVNLLRAVEAARETGVRCWAFTGPAPNPLAEVCDEVLAVPSPDSQVVQELHLVSLHLLCEYVDEALPLVRRLPRTTTVPRQRGVAVAGRLPAGRGDRALAVVNGYPLNGHGANGHGLNGHGANGHGSNGHGVNGHDTNGHRPDRRGCPS
ncbi:D-sedoheptulose-7-phosphate isomerase [Micromonospora coxensis]|uniref:D-sedoheptulose 7-phosphate isomerase n=1 Tax=Micromonospora coxensis TaxID=356852 RepID=A0A1C5JPT5_9ACTN|nr:SIS domain-containing protein [Micromonospora coxensis]SCG72580.1 D-sedoheptulose 7-phosphate isomerase [Micromonospora coxensis]